LGWAAVQVAELQTAPIVIQTGDGSTEGAGTPTLAIVTLAAALLAAGGVARWALVRRT
jgi:hypothetical protein